jgi:hypothetical protein
MYFTSTDKGLRSLAGWHLPGVLKKNTGKTLIGSFASVGVKNLPPKSRRRIWVPAKDLDVGSCRNWSAILGGLASTSDGAALA